MSLGLFLVMLAIASLVAGVLSLFSFLLAWEKVEPFYSSSAKGLVSLSRLISTGVIARFAVIWDGYAIVAFYASIASIFIWEIVTVWGDQKKKVSVEKLGAIKDQFLHRSRLLIALRDLENNNKQRVDAEIAKLGTSRPSIENVRKAFNSNAQVRRILDQIGAMFRAECPENPDGSVQNFRIAYYVENEGYMVENMSISLDEQKERFLKSYKLDSARKHFHVDCRVDPARVVKCVQDNKLIIVSDCATELRYFHDDQKNYLKSLIAYPILDYGCGPSDCTRAAIVIDTDVVDYFQEKDRANIKACLKEFGRRLALVNSFSRLVNPEGRKIDARSASGT